MSVLGKLRKVRNESDDDTSTPGANHGHQQTAPATSNRQQRRYRVKHFAARYPRKNLFGVGRWRRGTNVKTGRYDEPFGMDLR